MLKQVISKNFDAEPCYFKNELHLSRNNDKIYSLLFIKNEEIDELIKLLQDSKKQFANLSYHNNI